jgi:hypothetical protein
MLLTVYHLVDERHNTNIRHWTSFFLYLIFMFTTHKTEISNLNLANATYHVPDYKNWQKSREILGNFARKMI